MKKILVLLLILNKMLIGQSDSSKALVYFKEKGVVIYVNNKKIEPQKELQPLAVGRYFVKAWAPHYELLEDTFTVMANENKFYTKKLNYSEGYKSYRRRQDLFKLTYIIPVVASIITGLSFSNSYNIRNQDIETSYKKALDIKTEYEMAYSNQSIEIQSAAYLQEKAHYQLLIQQQQKFKTQGIIVASSCIATALTCYIIDLVRKRKPYKETPLLVRINPSYNLLTNQLCVNIKL